MHTHLEHSSLCLISPLLSLSSSLSRCLCLYVVLLLTRHSCHDPTADSHTLSHGDSQEDQEEEEEDHKDLVSTLVVDILITTLLLTLTRSRMTTLQEEQEEEEDHKPQVSSKVRVSLH